MCDSLGIVLVHKMSGGLYPYDREIGHDLLQAVEVLAREGLVL